MIERIISNLTHMMTQIETVGFCLFLVGITVLVVAGIWLAAEGVIKELNDDGPT